MKSLALLSLAIVLSGCALLKPVDTTGPWRTYDKISVSDAMPAIYGCLQAKKVKPENIQEERTSGNGLGRTYYVTSVDGKRDMKIFCLPGYQNRGVTVGINSPVKSGMSPSKYSYQEFYDCFETSLQIKPWKGPLYGDAK